ncbi:MAG TPA: iron ABC transporter permease [Chloroflexota bacterium]|nr:iron ABC transporter permease [Chloroflexota bacterium]
MTVDVRPAAPATRVGWLERLRAPTFAEGLFLATLAALLFLIGPPIFFLLRGSLSGTRGSAGALNLDAYAAVLGSPSLLSSLTATLVFALLSSVGAIVLGGLLAWIVERTDAPGKQALYASTFVVFAVPGIIRVVGWIFLLGPRSGYLNEAARRVFGDGATFDVFSMAGMVLVESLFWVPVVFLLMAMPLRSMDPALEEAAAMSGARPLRVLRSITLRLALPAVLSVLLLSFVRSIQAFEIPVLLGVPAGIRVLTTEVYLAVRESLVPRYGTASAYGVLTLGVVLVGLYFYSRVTRDAHRFATVTGKGFRPRVQELGPWRYPAAALVFLVVAVQLLPILALAAVSVSRSISTAGSFWTALTLEHYAAVLSSPALLASFRNSLLVGVFAASGAVVLSVLVAWLMARTRIPGRYALDQLASVPMAFPGVVLGVAFLQTYLTLPIPIYGTIWLLVVAFAVSFLPYAMRYSYPGILQIHPELEESAQTSGASWWRTFTRIVVPLLFPALFGGWIFIFLITVRELSIAALLYTQQSQVVATTILDLWVNGSTSQLSAFAMVVIGVMTPLSMLLYRLSRRFGVQL